MTYANGSVPSDAGAALAGKIEPFLSRGERALLLVSGGSCAEVAVDACARLRSALRGNEDARRLLTVTLADERYGPVDHADSNWRFLVERGFDPSPFDAVPLLDGTTDGASDEGLAETASRFGKFLAAAVAMRANGRLYIAAALGIGADGHTAGILPGYEAASLDPDGVAYAVGYRSGRFARVTIAPAFFSHIDYAAVWVNDRAKREALGRLAADGYVDADSAVGGSAGAGSVATGSVTEMPARLIARAREATLFKGDQL